MIYMEIRCENRSEENDNCNSHTNSDPHNFASDDKDGVTFAYKELEKVAKASGYKNHNGCWYCDNCVGFLGLA